MRFSSLTAFTVLGVVVSVLSQSGTDAASYFTSETSIAKAGLLANIGASGSKASGAKAGVVIASPSKSDPDYLYTWTRDSALVFQTIINQYSAAKDDTLRSHIDKYVAAQKEVQQVDNPSGSVDSGGLGEPKFNIDLSAFTGAWGRPQRDGPALRAIALTTWANYLLSDGNSSYVSDSLWPIIKLDLDYVSSTWSQSTFDLWEEVNSDGSFFTTASQHRALVQGAALATAIGETSDVSSYTEQASSALCTLQTYWTGSFINSNKGGGRSGKDANSVLGSIHTFDASAGCDPTTFQPCSDRALANLVQYVDSFRKIYSINEGISTSSGVATGRYPEDSYQGGNPWYLTTLAVAEQIYDSLIAWKQDGSITVTETSLPFFQALSSDIKVGSYDSSSDTFTTITSAAKDFADSFVAVVAKYTPSDGGLAEQFSRDSGSPVSAVDLTWSYASVLSSSNARDGYVPASWGASNVTLGNC